MESIFSQQICKEMKQIDIELTSRQEEQFYDYYKYLIEWNTMVNLTAITSMKEVITKHFVDSLTLKKVITDIGEKNFKLIDVGTGAGFPGIPLKIIYPDLEVTLLDSLNKRVRFLEAVCGKLELSGIKAVHGRAEDYGRENVSRETFDICVSRAVANLATLSEYCLPFVKVKGYFISYKSGKLNEELENAKKAIKKLSGEIEETKQFCLPNGDERILIKIAKVSPIQKKYPRKAGTPSKEPL